MVARTGDTLAYARALTEVEGLRCSSGMQLSLAATGGHLRGRVTRLGAAPAPQRGAVHWVAGLVLLATGLGAVSGARVALQEPPVPAPVSPLDSPPPTPADPIVEARMAVPPSPAADVIAAGALVPQGKAAAIAPKSPPVAPSKVPSATTAEYDRRLQAAGTSAPGTPPVVTTDTSAAVRARVDAAGENRAAPAPEAPPVRVAMIEAPAFAPASADRERIAPRLTVESRGAETKAAPEIQQPPAAPTPGSFDAAVEEFSAPSVDQGASPAGSAEPAAPQITGGALIKAPPPAYPRRARLKGQRGFVTARYTVDARGRVKDVTIVESTASLFERPVRRSLRKWRYEPFMADGEPVKLTLERTFEFDVETAAFADRERNVRCAKVTGSRLCRSRTGYDDLGVVVVYNDP